MKVNINHGTISCDNTTQSAIILNRQLVLASGALLYKNETKSKRKLKIFYKTDDLDNFLVEDVQIFRILESENVKNTLKLLFSHYKKNVNGSYENLNDLIEYLSKFVLLTFKNQQTPDIDGLINLVEIQNIKIQDEIFTKTTPFGLEYLHNSLNNGIISNIFGDNGCLIHLSCPLVLGCEGGGVYDKRRNLLGMVIFSSLKSTDDNVYFTLAVNLKEIFKEFNVQVPENIILKNQNSKYAVLLEGTKSWGSGCLVYIQDRKFILTCSHVVQDEKATCYWSNGSFLTKIIYKTPMSHAPYDIAILDTEQGNISESYFSSLSKKTPKIGQKIYAVGFPLTKVLGINDFRPSILSGCVTKYEKGIMFTDCSIQSGQSGCGIFDKTGNVIGIAVSNFRKTDNDVVYPFSNMSIPICDIQEILNDYVTSNDRSILDQLIANKEIKRKWQLKLKL